MVSFRLRCLAHHKIFKRWEKNSWNTIGPSFTSWEKEWKRHSAEIEKYSISDQIELLDEIMEKGVSYFNIKKENDTLSAELLLSEEKLTTIKVSYINWDKLGKSFMSKPEWPLLLYQIFCKYLCFYLYFRNQKTLTSPVFKPDYYKLLLRILFGCPIIYACYLDCFVLLK